MSLFPLVMFPLYLEKIDDVKNTVRDSNDSGVTSRI